MAPKSWATEEQLVFLNANKTDFWKYSEQGRQSKFWPLIRGKWFDIWPEVKALIEAKILPEEAANHDKLGPDGVPLYKMMETEAQLYGASITKREKQIKTWYHNSRKKDLGTSNLRSLTQKKPVTFKIPKQKTKRLHQREEIFHHIFRHKISRLAYVELRSRADAYEDKRFEGVIWDSADDESEESTGESDSNSSVDGDDEDVKAKRDRKPPGYSLKGLTKENKMKFEALQMSVLREIRRKAWVDADDSAISKVEHARSREKVAMRDAAEQEADGLDRSPEERQKTIDELVAVLQSTCFEIHRLTGWYTYAITGGPNPSRNDKVMLRTVCFGETSAGLSFSQSYTKFHDDCVQPYLEWLKKVFATKPLAAGNAKTAQANLDLERDGSSRPASPNPLPQYASSASRGSSPPPTSLPPSSPAPPSSPNTSAFDEDHGLYRLSPEPLPLSWFDNQQHAVQPRSLVPNAPNGPSEPIEMAMVRNGLGHSLSAERLPSTTPFTLQHPSSPQLGMVIDPLLMEMGSSTMHTVAHRPRPRPRLPVTLVPVPASVPASAPLPGRNAAVAAESNTAKNPVPQAVGDGAANSEPPVAPSLSQQTETASYETRPPTQYRPPALPVIQRAQRGRRGRGRGRGGGRGGITMTPGSGVVNGFDADEGNENENEGEIGGGGHGVHDDRSCSEREGEEREAGETAVQNAGEGHDALGEGNRDGSEEPNTVDIGLLVDECRARAQTEGFRGRKRKIKHARQPPRADHNRDGNHALVTFTPDPTTTSTAKRVRKAVTQVDGTTAPAIRTAEAIHASQMQAQDRAAERAAKKTKSTSQPTASTSSTSQPTASSSNINTPVETPLTSGERSTRVRKPVTRVDGTVAPAVRTADEIAASAVHTKRKQVVEPATSAKRTKKTVASAK